MPALITDHTCMYCACTVSRHLQPPLHEEDEARSADLVSSSQAVDVTHECAVHCQEICLHTVLQHAANCTNP